MLIISCKILIITVISNETTNELTIYAKLCRNFTIFYRQETVSLFQVLEKLRTCGRWKSKTRVTSSNPRVTSSNPRVTSSNLRVTSSNPQVTSSNPRVRRLKARVARLKARVGRLKARVGRLKTRVGRLKARAQAIELDSKQMN